jgi:hypothetical protein
MVLAFLLGCQDDPFGPDDWRDLSDAEARWQATRPTDYAFELRLSCFCGNALPVFTLLEVRGDSLVAATPIAPPPGLPVVPLAQWPTVPDLFAQLRATATAANDDDVIVDVTADYDPVYGYPIRIAVQCRSDVTDCGSLIEARGLQPLP